MLLCVCVLMLLFPVAMPFGLLVLSGAVRILLLRLFVAF